MQSDSEDERNLDPLFNPLSPISRLSHLSKLNLLGLIDLSQIACTLKLSKDVDAAIKLCEDSVLYLSQINSKQE